MFELRLRVQRKRGLLQPQLPSGDVRIRRRPVPPNRRGLQRLRDLLHWSVQLLDGQVPRIRRLVASVRGAAERPAPVTGRIDLRAGSLFNPPPSGAARVSRYEVDDPLGVSVNVRTRESRRGASGAWLLAG